MKRQNLERPYVVNIFKNNIHLVRSDNLPDSVVVDTSGSSISGTVGTQAFEHLTSNRNTARFIILL